MKKSAIEVESTVKGDILCCQYETSSEGVWLQIIADFEFKKKQATGGLILLDTVNLKADTISHDSHYHSGSMKTFVTEINSHPCNEYIIKNY